MLCGVVRGVHARLTAHDERGAPTRYEEEELGRGTAKAVRRGRLGASCCASLKFISYQAMARGVPPTKKGKNPGQQQCPFAGIPYGPRWYSRIRNMILLLYHVYGDSTQITGVSCSLRVQEKYNN